MPFGIAGDTLNVLLGAGIALFSTFAANWNRRRVERVRLRRSLIVEIKSMESVICAVISAEELDDDYRKRLERVNKRLSTSIYNDNRVNIKSLTQREIEMLVTFYPMVESFIDELTSTGVSSEPNRARISNERTELIKKARGLYDVRDDVLQELENGPLTRFLSNTFSGGSKYQSTNNPKYE